MFQDAGRQVMIASTCAFGRQLYSAILPGSVCVVNEAMGGIDRFEFEGRVFRYHQPASGQFNTQTLNETLRAIEAFDPAMVLAIGVQNLTAELLDAGRFVVQYPTIAGLPTTRNNHFFMWREPTAEEAELIEQLGLGKNFLFSHHPGFAPPPRTTTLSRAPFAIPEDAFVFAVVRMRLDDDIDDAFLALMRDVRARAPNAHFVFIGEFDGFFQRVGADPSVAGYATHVGFQSDIMAAYELCDAYINPTPKGGGSAIVHALTAGLPALSTNQGDAYEAVRTFPVIEDFAVLARVAADLAQRGKTFEAYVRMAKARAPTLNSKAPVVEKLLAAYETFARRPRG
jgi:glycosyltransferase involved in cell wall biosynthesis